MLREAKRMHRIAVGFDFDHTLGVDNKLEIEAFVRLAQSCAISSNRTLDAEVARRSMQHELERYRNGRCSLDDAVSRALEAAIGLSNHESAAALFRSLAVKMVPDYVRPMPGVTDLLHSLESAEIPHAILTNGWNPLQQRKADSIGFKRPVFVSDDIGVRKPSVHAFDVLSDYFNLPGDCLWYVGDDPMVDIVGALSAGMKAIWFDAEGKKYPTDIPGPTAIVGHIADVLTCFG